MRLSTSVNEIQCCFFANASVCTSNNHNFTINSARTSVHCAITVPSEMLDKIMFIHQAVPNPQAKYMS